MQKGTDTTQALLRVDDVPDDHVVVPVVPEVVEVVAARGANLPTQRARGTSSAAGVSSQASSISTGDWAMPTSPPAVASSKRYRW